MTGRSELAACTIAPKAALAQVRTLARSYRDHHPGSPFFFLLVDGIEGRFDPAREPFELVELAALGIPDLRPFAFRHTARELCSAVKARFLRRLLEGEGFRKVVYLDPAVLVLRDLAPLPALLDRHPIVLTPHLTAPYQDALSPTEVQILQAGAYNLGFIGLAAGDTTSRFLRWWDARLAEQCEMAPEQGLYLDQRWVDLVPGLYEDVLVLRDPGFNVGYWNLHERVLQVDGGDVTVNGHPCRFVQFSGFDPAVPWRVSSHQTRVSMAGLGPGAALFQRYRQDVLAAGHAEMRAWPYTFGTFSNGVPIPDVARRMYRAVDDARRRFGDPFDVGAGASFFAWLSAGVDGLRLFAGAVPRIWFEVYHQQPELRLTYPDVLGRDRPAFRQWIVEHGAAEHGIDPLFTPDDVVRPGPAGGLVRRGLRRSADAALRVERAARRLARLEMRRHPRTLQAIKSWRDRWRARPTAPVTAPAAPAPGTAVQALPDTALGVNVAGLFNSEKGVGEAARATVMALRAADVPVVLNGVIDVGSANREATGWPTSEQNPHPVNLIHVNLDLVQEFMASRGESYFQGRLNVGFWFWELAAFPDEWAPRFRRLDEVWVATAFTQEALARVSPVPVVRMPVAIEAKPPRSGTRDRARFGLGEDVFVFLFVFDFHSQLERKNPLALVDAFRLAFGDRDDVALVLKSAHSVDYDSGARVTDIHEVAARAKNVAVIDTVLARVELDALLGTADCYVSLHRSEGFGLPIAESMSRGIPVIVTGYSGNMDFTTPANSYLVKYRLVELDRDHGPYRRGSVWADPDRHHAAELMRHVVDHPDQAREVGRLGREHVERFHDPRRVGTSMRERLARLLVARR